MKTLISFWETFSLTEMVLIILTGVFFLNILLFLSLIAIRRSRKRRRKKLNERYAKHVEENLFSIAFDNHTLTNLQQDRFFRRYWKKSSYKRLFLQELIKLHRLYGGEIALKLQQFYKYSGLMHLSYEKIRNRNWYLKCEGIQELSEMEIQKAATIIFKLTLSENETLKMVALTEFLHLKGLEGLYLLKNYDQPLNDWIQLNLLESIKEKQINEVPDFGYLLQSKNSSLVVFGLRLISLFQQNQHLETISALKESSLRKVRLEAQRTFKDLSF
ncbi:MAG TPA: hypothetical protein ENO10_01995 [Salinimicrobium catena]|uniref:HEAT repeat domain-containing protein n=1 Tax=Salinimicrobium catena TaxID=390640 RepID=A0A7C2R870_9FLAO|nr:hypothetical protein [Salinimicrobium catena]